ncbi:hypothetical protein ADIAG_04000 [Paeniglutamicibacter gangotriensis Lz1y]|uniref:Uncharacterized protein n=1 Tax=Paeniglutamicibacter gangotriensis Lz1y TaxID=1276920 RepID=M7N4I8_9MICC|nr:hypothetical protein ADIAG_04000 [Paeniglutamicibacter gangotriensis Lz1y]
MFRETGSAGGRGGCRRRECHGNAAISKIMAVKSSDRLAPGTGARLIEVNVCPLGAAASDKLVERTDALQSGLGNGPSHAAWSTG